jgi:hypothetical protein
MPSSGLSNPAQGNRNYYFQVLYEYIYVYEFRKAVEGVKPMTKGYIDLFIDSLIIIYLFID